MDSNFQHQGKEYLDFLIGFPRCGQKETGKDEVWMLSAAWRWSQMALYIRKSQRMPWKSTRTNKWISKIARYRSLYKKLSNEQSKMNLKNNSIYHSM